MTEENEAVEAVEVAEGAKKGRPRPTATLELDARVDEAVQNAGKAGVTRDELATTLEKPANKIYLSLYRLRVENKIHRVRASRTVKWFAGPKPAEAPAEETPVAVEQP